MLVAEILTHLAAAEVLRFLLSLFASLVYTLTSDFQSIVPVSLRTIIKIILVEEAKYHDFDRDTGPGLQRYITA